MLLPLLIFSQGAIAEEKTSLETLSVFGQKESLPTRPGSAHILSPKELRIFEYNDVTRVLRTVPGVNIQEEDGFGLRPNIGLRGAHPHRSRKITLMEDGVLIAPAPYAAPAAYYFPQMDKTSSIEVFKGVPSVRFGPNSIGGAINMLSRVNDPGAQADISYGSFNFQKYDASIGIETFGNLTLDLTRISHDGFKDLPGGGDTGFVRQNVMLRWDKYISTMDQNINIKLNYADEDSRETYLGLSEEDFESDPYQRYEASREDHMRWRHKQLFVSYALSPLQDLRVRTTLYHHELDRSWNKFNGFFDENTNAQEVLRDPNDPANLQYYLVLKGLADSALPSDRDVLRITNNTRSYYSQGVQFKTDYEITGFSWDHSFTLGYRFHKDQVDRNHFSNFFAVQSGRLVERADLGENIIEKSNSSFAEAQTLTLGYETTWESLFVQSALRYEDIRYQQFDQPNAKTATSSASTSKDHVFAPGLGIFHQTFSNGGFLLGVHKGFTPVGPGQSSQVNPEEAMNYEAGFRYTGDFGVELIGFYSDYTNILGTCTQSSGCNVSNLDQRFNGGEAEIIGAELLVSKEFKTKSFNVPVRMNATYTQAEFKNSFSTTLNDWGSGDVISGDPIPYIPEFQGNIMVGVEWSQWSGFFNFNYLGEMADQAVAENRRYIDSRFVLDFSLRYNMNPSTQFYFKADNITSEDYAVSLRPIGLRPGKPQTFIVGAKYDFF